MSLTNGRQCSPVSQGNQQPELKKLQFTVGKTFDTLRSRSAVGRGNHLLCVLLLSALFVSTSFVYRHFCIRSSTRTYKPTKGNCGKDGRNSQCVWGWLERIKARNEATLCYQNETSVSGSTKVINCLVTKWTVGCKQRPTPCLLK